MKKYYSETKLKQVFGLNDRYFSRYESEGILKPADVADTEEKCFSYKEVHKMESVLKLRDSGVDLKTAGTFLRDSSVIEKQIARLQEERNEIDRKIKGLESYRSDSRAFIIKPMVLRRSNVISAPIECSLPENGYGMETRKFIMESGENLFNTIYEKGGHISNDTPTYFSFDINRFRDNNHSCLQTYMLTEPMEDSYIREQTPAIFTFVRGCFDFIPEVYEALLKCVELKGLRPLGKVYQWLVSIEENDKGVVGFALPVESTKGMGNVIIMRK